MRPTAFLDSGKALIEFYRLNPIIAAEDLLGIDLDVVQAIILEDMWFKPYVITTAGRGVGKSFLLSVVAVLRCMLYQGERVGIISSSFRQAKNTFMEVKRRWEGSPIVREAANKRPTFGADRCYLEFRSVNDKQSSIIESLPIGDGQKIRGSRFYTILIDEYAFVPSDIVDMVITPMAATSANPMERVRLLERIKKMKESGMYDEKFDYSTGQANKLIGTTSAYFTFNHVHNRIETFRGEISKGSKKHAVHFVSYDDMSEGFIEMNNVMLAKSTMPDVLFKMEYGAEWQADTDGVFKASLLESAKEGGCGVKAGGAEGKSYIMGVDPARSSDAFAISIIEEGSPANLVYARESKNNKYPEMADIIFDLTYKFNVSEIMLDSGAGGGGLALKDILADPDKYGNNAILDMDDLEYLETPGRKILKLFKPSPQTNAEAVFGALNLLEQKKLKLQFPPQNGIDAEDEVYEVLETLYKQLVSIVITETRSGLAHFDVVGGGGHGGAKKDLYSSFVLACKSLYDRIYHVQDDSSIHNIVGLVIPRDRTLHRWGFIR